MVSKPPGILVSSRLKRVVMLRLHVSPVHRGLLGRPLPGLAPSCENVQHRNRFSRGHRAFPWWPRLLLQMSLWQHSGQLKSQVCILEWLVLPSLLRLWHASRSSSIQLKSSQSGFVFLDPCVHCWAGITEEPHRTVSWSAGKLVSFGILANQCTVWMCLEHNHDNSYQ